MKFKIILIIAAILICVPSLFAGGDSLCIHITAPQLRNKSLMLNSYFNGKLFTIDSCTISSKGTGSFHSGNQLDEGLYMISMDNGKYFDVLLSDKQSFHIEIDTTDLIGKNKISGAEQSEAFAEYVRFISEKHKVKVKLFEQKSKLKEENETKDSVLHEINALDQEVRSFQQSFAEKHQGQWVSKFFLGMNSVEGPFPNPKTQAEAMEEFYFLKEHYFDNIDLTDRRFWRTNYFPQMIARYMQSKVEQEPDSLANVASGLVAQTLEDSVCSRMMISFLLTIYVKSEIMGMENVWAKLAEDYFLKGYAAWADSSFMAEINSEYNKIKYCRIGLKAQNIMLQDSMRNPTILYEANNDYTLLCFYEPSCGHCKKVIPDIYNELYKKYSNKGLTVNCIYLLTDRKEWMTFVQEHGLNGEHWRNLWDPDRTSHYWQFYDTSITPALFLLNKDGKIIAKRIDVESMDKILGNLLGQN